MTTYINATYHGNTLPFIHKQHYGRLIFKPALIGYSIKIQSTRSDGRAVLGFEIEYRNFYELSQEWDIHSVTNNPNQPIRQKRRKDDD